MDTPIPFAPCLERAVLPGVDDIVRAVKEIV
jgi:pyruvate/2-oxoglutarate/acetoin dehydrogenase E1 component